ncbi:hypothetical protein TNCV_4209141 [Trichonephila clavipes]|nr:hypothetical protein TNCV_4209141 [Trichonephila clavipes]
MIIVGAKILAEKSTTELRECSGRVVLKTVAPPGAFQTYSMGFKSEDLAGHSILNLQVFNVQSSHVWTRVILHKNRLSVKCPFEKSHTGF